MSRTYDFYRDEEEMSYEQKEIQEQLEKEYQHYLSQLTDEDIQEQIKEQDIPEFLEENPISEEELFMGIEEDEREEK
jgi:hypothetical protein